MFLGAWSQSIDTAGRVVVPTAFRQRLNESLVITRGFDRCLQVFPKSVWTQLANRISSLPLSSEAARQLRRFVFADALEITLDESGVIELPTRLRQYAALQQETIVAGLNSYFEVWDATTWETLAEDLEQHASSLAETLAEVMTHTSPPTQQSSDPRRTRDDHNSTEGVRDAIS